MKKSILSSLLAAGVLLCGASASASASDQRTLASHVQTLACLASEMESAFLDDLREMHRHFRPSYAEFRFSESLCELSRSAGQFRLAVQSGSAACELERSFAAMREAMERVEDSSGCVKICLSIRGMMQRFEDTLDCVEELAFAPPAHHHQQHGHLEGSNTRGIYFRVPIPQRLPFVFRQPMR